jgi:transglutaminase-like putative cysteine protease
MLFDSGAREQAWDKNLQLLLVLIISFNILPHMSSIPTWATLISFILLGWKVLSLLRGAPRPPRSFLYIVALACAAGVFFEYHTILGQEAASALLVTLASAKLLETNRYRDAMFVIFTSFFLLMAHLLDSQTIATTIYMAVDVMLITALMFQLHKQERRRSARSFRPVMKTLMLAIPVWIFLFVAFPRFSAGFWGQQTQGPNGGGFSDDLNPGSVEAIIDSDEPAFRVTFEGRLPSLAEMYWRGGILTVSDGLMWRKSKEKTPTPDILIPSEKNPTEVSYKVFLEPRFQSWVFALDYPTSLTSRQQQRPSIRRRPGFIFENLQYGSGQIVYDGSAARSAPLQKLLNEDRAKMLQLPEDLDPRIQELASRLAKEARTLPESRALPTLSDRIGFHVEEWFDQEKFRYTKSPGSFTGHSGSEQLADFLFKRKQGFCEHYAAAYATLMRASGVPARVTVGFLGASKNVYSNYFIVRDLDAHAWTEIWRDDPNRKGIGHWVRVDPTALIAPLRLQMGGDFNLLDPSTYRKDLSQAEAELTLRVHNSRLYYKASLAWDALQMKWNAFLNDYDFEFQKSFLEKLGIKDVTRWVLFAIAAGGVVLFALGLSIVLRRRALKVDPVLLTWNQLCKKLERAGLRRTLTEGPLDFTSRAAGEFPDEGTRLTEIGAKYAELRYGPEVSPAAIKDFRRSVNHFSIKPKR